MTVAAGTVAEARVVTMRRIDDVLLLTIDNPPVNALSLRVRRQLGEALETAAADRTLRGIVIACAGRTFVAGADISEFGTPKQTEEPILPTLCRRIESLPMPVVAAIHGTALGGGLELALSCHHRIADRRARLGLPEVNLGLIPGSGGTVRLPRVVGPVMALEMIVTGTPVSAETAIAAGLVDRLAETDLVAEAVAFAGSLAETRGYVPQPVRGRDAALEDVRRDASAFEERAERLLSRDKGLSAPAACAQAVRNAFSLSFDEALAKERETFLRLSAGLESKALRHLFFAEREAAKIPGLQKDVRPRTVARVGVVGAGTMGTGIAIAFAAAGCHVTVLETNEAALERGLGIIDGLLATSVARGSLSEQQRGERQARMTGTTGYEDLAGCDLVVEAAFEDMATKKQVFERLGAIARPGCILATNTSYLDVDAIAAASGRQSDVVGLHFFSPANVMKLLEVVRGKETAPDVIATALAVARSMGKVPVVVGVCHGFVGNRMLAARGAELEGLLLEGASIVQVDKAFTDFGWAMGPFQMLDLAGLDIDWRSRKARGLTAALADELCRRGRFGQKAGAGWYRYEAGSRQPQPDPQVSALIEETAERHGIARRQVTDREILERTLLPMVNEGRRILDEGIASRASDIDLVWVHGYGFPKAKGGPMFWAENQSDFDLEARLDHWFAATGREIFKGFPPRQGFPAG